MSVFNAYNNSLCYHLSFIGISSHSESHFEGRGLITVTVPSPLCLCAGLCLPLSAVLGSAELLAAAEHQEEDRLRLRVKKQTEFYLTKSELYQ